MSKFVKKSYLRPFLFFSALLILMGCKQEESKQPSAETTKEIVKAPEQIVSLEQAQIMYGNYTERRVPLIQKYEDGLNSEKAMAEQKESKQDSFIVARYIYYDYQTIKDYLAYIEKQAADAKVEISSLRFYLSNYPDKQEFDNGKPIIHPKQNSILILPAVKTNKTEYGLYLNELENGQKVPVYLTDDLKIIPSNEVGTLSERSKNFAGMATGLNSNNKVSNKPLPFVGNFSLFLNEGGSSPPKNN